MYAYTERQRDGIIGTAAVQLKAYGHPGAARTATRHEGLTPALLFARGRRTRSTSSPAASTSSSWRRWS